MTPKAPPDPEADAYALRSEVDRQIRDALAEEVPVGEARVAVGSALESAIASAESARAILDRASWARKGPTILVAPKALGRVTGWVVVCPTHGAKDVAAPSLSAAVSAAATHLEEAHHGAGEIKRTRPVRTGSRSRG